MSLLHSCHWHVGPSAVIHLLLGCVLTQAIRSTQLYSNSAVISPNGPSVYCTIGNLKGTPVKKHPTLVTHSMLHHQTILLQKATACSQT